MKIQGHPRNAGKRGRTRSKMKKHGPKVSVNDIMVEYGVGDKVQVVIDSSHHSGLPDKSFHGLTGNIAARRGLTGYEVAVMKGNQKSIVVTTAVHLKKLV